jgi:hypothetical protein
MPKHHFKEVDKLRDPHTGILAVYSEQLDTGRVLCMLAREFDCRDEVRRTSFLKKQHLMALQNQLGHIIDRLDVLEDQARARRRMAHR